MALRNFIKFIRSVFCSNRHEYILPIREPFQIKPLSAVKID